MITDSINTNTQKWEVPTGQLMRFDSAEDLEYFIRRCNFTQEELLYCIPGVTCEIDDPCEIDLDVNNDDDTAISMQKIENMPDDWEYSKVNILPIFANGQKEYLYMLTANATYGHKFNIKRIEIDTNVWRFPVIAYVNFDEIMFRTGDCNLSIFNIMPLNQIPTIESLKQKEQKFKDMWIKNLQNEIDIEQRILRAESRK